MRVLEEREGFEVAMDVLEDLLEAVKAKGRDDVDMAGRYDSEHIEATIDEITARIEQAIEIVSGAMSLLESLGVYDD